MLNKVLVGVVAVVLTLGLSGHVQAATTVNLATADSFAVLAGTAVTNVPTSAITGNMGLSPAAGSNYGAGVTTAQVTGTIYAVDSSGPAGAAGNNPTLMTSAKNDLTAAYLDAAGRTPTTTFVAGDNQLGGQVLAPGVYAFGHGTTANLVGTLTLDGLGDANSVFIFQASSDLVTASSSVVALANSAQACNVFWQVTSSATLGTSSTFVGTIMALTSVGLNTSATMVGRALARNAAVTLDQNTITRPTCAAAAAAAATTSNSTSTSTSTTTPTATTSTTSTAAATTIPGLPNTGLPVNNKNTPWNIAIPAGILLVALISGAFLIKRNSA